MGRVRSVVDAYTSHVARKEKRSGLMKGRERGETGYEKGREGKGATFKTVSGTLLRAGEPPASLGCLFALTTFARIDCRATRARAARKRHYRRGVAAVGR